jgi:hypothetical protein
MGSIVISIGGLIALIGFVLILIEAFKKSIVWGIVVLLTCGIGMLIFTFTNWAVAKKGFLIWLAGFAIEMIGVVLGGAAAFMHK